MKKTIFILTLLFPLLVCGQVTDYSITHDQYYVIPEEAENNWYVGQFHANASDSYLFTRTGSYSFAIVSGNTNSAFSIDTTGMIKVNNRNQFYGGGDDDYRLGIVVSIDSESDTAYANIHVIDDAKCTYVDMDATNGNGSLVSPYPKFSDATQVAGHGIFLKRGSTGGTSHNMAITENFSLAAPLYVAAYGIGEKPFIENTNQESETGIYIDTSFVNVYDISVKGFFNPADSAQNGVCIAPHKVTDYVYLRNHNVYINRVESERSGYNGEFYSKPWTHAVFRDCEGKNNVSSHIFKLEGEYDTLVSCSAINAPKGNGYSFPHNKQVGGLLVYSYAAGGFQTAALSIRGPKVEVAFNYLSGGYRIMYVYSHPTSNPPDRPDSLFIHHNIFNNPNGSFAVGIENVDSMRFEHNTIIGCINTEKALALYGDCNRLHIKGNKIYGNSYNGIDFSSTASDVNNTYISYNEIYSNSIGINILNAGTGVKIFNNTIVKNTSSDLNNSSSTNIELKNNIYENISGNNWSPNTNNYSLGNDPFVDYGNNDFLLDSIDALSLIDQGFDYGPTVDIEELVVPQYNGTDIGAHEYGGSLPEETVTVNISKQSDAAEENQQIGTFRITRTGSTTDSLTVNLGALGGTAYFTEDYSISETDSVIILNGNSYVDVTVTPVNDTQQEGNETVSMALASGDGYTIGSPASATLTIVDNDEDEGPIAHWMFEDNGVDSSGNGNDLTFVDGTYFMSNGAIGKCHSFNSPVRYAECGQINLGNEFTIAGWYRSSSLTGERTIIANSTHVPNGFWLYLTAVDNKFVFSTGDGSTIENATSTTDHWTADTWIHFAVVVDKIAGSCTFYVDGVEETDDGDEVYSGFVSNANTRLARTTNNFAKLYGHLDDVRLYDYKLSAAAVYALVNYDQLPEITITATDDDAAEHSNDAGEFMVSRGNETSGDLSVSYTIGGTAGSSDYSETLTQSVIISDGDTSATIIITPVDDSEVEDDETVILTLATDPDYTISTPNSATVTIDDNDVPEIIITATDDAAAEQSSDEGEFTVSRGAVTLGNLSISYTIGGTAGSSDYSETLTQSVIISDGDTSATIIITPVDDSEVEDEETVVLTLATDPDYTIGTPNSATVTIADNDEDDGPIAHWMFEGNGADSSGNGYDATLYGSPTFPVGEIGDYGISLNASTRYVDCGQINLGDAFTIAGWYKVDSEQLGIRTLIANGASSPDGFWLSVRGDGQFYFVTSNGVYANNQTSTSTAGHHEENEWIHFVVVVDKSADTCAFYVNGSDETYNGDNMYAGFNTNADIILGRTTNEGYKLYGSLDDIRLYDYKLSSTDISAIHNKLKKGKLSSELEDRESQISIYPVPFKNTFTLSGIQKIIKIEVVNIYGESILVKNNSGNVKMEIEMEEFPVGYYIVKLTDYAGHVVVKKLIKK